MPARLRAIDNEAIRLLDRVFVPVPRDVPHHHLITGTDGLAAQLRIRQCRAPHVNDRRLVTDDFRHQRGDQRRVLSQLAILVGELVQRQQPAGHRIARGVVAADDQQRQVAHELAQRHLSRRLAMRQHREQIEFGRLARSLGVQRGHVLRHAPQFLEALLLGMHRRVGRVDIADRHIGPIGQFAPLLPREVEQSRQHHRGQLDGDAIHPVERLVARQLIQNAGRPRADRRLHVAEIVGGDDRANHLALFAVPGRVHTDEAGAGEFLRLVLDLDAASARIRGIHPVVRLDFHDVPVLRHRPIGAVRAVGTPVHRILAPQPREIRPHCIALVEFRPANIDRLQRHRPGVARRIVTDQRFHCAGSRLWRGQVRCRRSRKKRRMSSASSAGCSIAAK